MTINKALLALAMGVALAACREQEKDEPEADDAPHDDEAAPPESRTGEG